jgi:hypothetical protein
MLQDKIDRTLAITMWDFSWLERRWPGAGYEDWDQVLDELKVRGYDAVRIDPYPHFIDADPARDWLIHPFWDQHDWGSPGMNRVAPMPALMQFIEKCAARDLWVALSTWFTRDAHDVRMGIQSPEDHARVWVSTLKHIDDAGLLDRILYVDLCNEWPLSLWAPFFNPDGAITLQDDRSAQWISRAIQAVKAAYPQLDYTFSFTGSFERWREIDVAALDFLEPHLWMTNHGGFYEQIGGGIAMFDRAPTDSLVANGERVYRENPRHWQGLLRHWIGELAEWSRISGKPLITTECWAIVSYRDWPLLDWGWIKELCEVGVTEAAQAGQWVAIATSNFCGPQFVGMWRDVAWHRRLTDLIHASAGASRGLGQS